MGNLDSQILSDRARAEQALENAKNIELNNENELEQLETAISEALSHTDISVISYDIGVKPSTTGTDGTIGAYFKEEGTLQKLEESAGAWNEIGFPLMTKMGDKFAVVVNAYGAEPDAANREDTTATDHTTAFKNAAGLADTLGLDFLTAHPGYYRCAGLKPADINDLKIVGSGIRFTKDTYVYAFNDEDERAKADNYYKGRGKIGLVFDDGRDSQWNILFPEMKKMGVPWSTAWIVDSNQGTDWVPSAYRHGVEIKGHSIDNTEMTTLTDSELHSYCQQTKSGLANILNDAELEDVQFVYPKHNRNKATDYIVRQYFPAGARGIASNKPIGQDDKTDWLLKAGIFGDFMTGAGYQAGDKVSEAGKEFLKNIAETDSKIVLYGHEMEDAGPIRDFISHCKALGIHIDLPRNIQRAPDLWTNPYLESDKKTTINLDNFVFDSTKQFKSRGRSTKIVLDSDFKGGHTRIESMMLGHNRPDFALVRISFWRYNDTDIDLSGSSYSQRGLNIKVGGFASPPHGSSISSSTLASDLVDNLYRDLIPASTDDANAVDGWVKEESYIYISSQSREIYVDIRLTHLPNTSGDVSLYLTNIRVEHITNVPVATLTKTCKGTSGVDLGVESNIFVKKDQDNTFINAIGAEQLAGSLYVNSRTVYSTDDADDGKTIKIFVHRGNKFGLG